MKVYKLSQIGEFHTNHNEDAYTITDIGNEKFLLAVMDGCSMGKESHFASTLIAKLLRKISKELRYQLFLEQKKQTTEQLLKEVLRQLFNDLLTLKNHLHLEIEEILSTLILGILDQTEKNINLITIGDGLIAANGELYEYEQADKPDYLGYHLSENFEDWFESQNQRLTLRNISDVSLSTDGIFTFKNFDGKSYPKLSEALILKLFLMDENKKNPKNMLQKKLLVVENNYGLKPSDDLTIIRVILD